jgi:hypothetical protein
MLLAVLLVLAAMGLVGTASPGISTTPGVQAGAAGR